MPQIVVPAVLGPGEEHVGVPGDHHHGGLEDVLLFQQQGQEVPHQLGGEHDLLAAVDLEAQIGRDPVHGDDGQLLLGPPAQEGHHVGLPVPEEGQGLVHADDLGEEQALDIAEELLAHQLVHLADLLKVQHVHLIGPQLLPDGLPQAVQQGLLLPGDLQNLLDHGLRQQARQGVGLVGSQHGPVEQDADTHPVELLQVGLIDHQELEPLQQGHRRIRRLQQHPVIEGQPAQLAVDVNALRGADTLRLGFLVF